MSRYDPMQPRDWHGRWTDTGNESGAREWRQNLSLKAEDSGGDDNEEHSEGIDGGRGDASGEDEGILTIVDGRVVRGRQSDVVRLPPDAPERRHNDEAESLLEWIANARPEDEQAIRAEITRAFADRGDKQGADWLNNFLDHILRHDPSHEERERLLKRVAPFLGRDPELGRDLTSAIAAILGIYGFRFPGNRINSFPRRPKPPHRPPGGAVVDQRHPYWDLLPIERGTKFEALWGPILHKNFPTIDTYVNGVVTSIKSLDLTAGSYLQGPGLWNRLNQYIEKVAHFDGKEYADITVRRNDIVSRALRLIIPKGAATPAQRTIINEMIKRAESRGVELVIHEM